MTSTLPRVDCLAVECLLEICDQEYGARWKSFVRHVPLLLTSVQSYQRARMGIFAKHRGKEECLLRQPMEPRLDKGASQEGHEQ